VPLNRESVSFKSLIAIRVEGFVASQEVILGGLDQTLKIRHDTINRESFVPGILWACKKVVGLNGKGGG